jgi:broad specificity phosphatase PhoE
MLPLDLILVRHGESYGNVAQIRSEQDGDHSAYTDAFRARHTSTHRLTDQGVLQAKAAGAWLDHAGFAFDRAHVSEYMRAIETAGHLGLDVPWVTTPMLRERDNGLMDGLPHDERQSFTHHVRLAKMSKFYWSPPEGESLAQLATRLHAGYLRELEQGKGSCAIAVCHGHTIRVLRAIIEGIPAWTYDAHEEHRLRDRDNTYHRSTANAQIFHYTRVCPEGQVPRTRAWGRDGEMRAVTVEDDFTWVRTIIPWDPGRIDTSWERIERPTYRSEDLLAIAARYPRE